MHVRATTRSNTRKTTQQGPSRPSEGGERSPRTPSKRSVSSSKSGRSGQAEAMDFPRDDGSRHSSKESENKPQRNSLTVDNAGRPETSQSHNENVDPPKIISIEAPTMISVPAEDLNMPPQLLTPASLDGDWDGLQTNESTWLQRQKSSQASCKSLPFTAVFYVSFFMAQVSHRDVSTVYPLTSTLQSTMLSGTVPSPLMVPAPETGNALSTSSRYSQLKDVKSWGDALMYVERTVVPFLWAEGDGGTGAVMGINQLIGGARLQQWRLAPVECEGSSELRVAYGDFMRTKYNRTCRSREGLTDTADIDGSQPANFSILQGSRLDAETQSFIYWIPAESTGPEALDHVKGLRDTRWLSAATGDLSLQYIMYCGQVGVFAHVEILMSMDRVGAFTSVVKTKALQTQVFAKMSTKVADLWFCVNLLYLFCGESFGIVKAYREKSLAKYLFQFYRLVNWALIVIGCGVVGFFVGLNYLLGGLGEDLTTLLAVDATAKTGGEVADHFAQLDEAYNTMSYLAQTVRWNELVTFWYSMMMLLKFFQNFQANERLAVITDTLSMAADDLLHFLLIFLLVLFNFIMGAYFLFGQSLKDWSSPILAFNTGFRALMGDFDFNAMYQVAPMSATIWFLIYMGFIFLLLINMLLAIVMDAYANVKREAGKSESMIHMIRRQARKAHAQLMKKELPEDIDVTSLQEEDQMDLIQRKVLSLEAGMTALLKHHKVAPRRGSGVSALGGAPRDLRMAGSASRTGTSGFEKGTETQSMPISGAAGHRRGSSDVSPRDVPTGPAADEAAPLEWIKKCTCGHEFITMSKFCAQCGERRAFRRCQLAKECSDCHNVYHSDECFCRRCGLKRPITAAPGWVCELGVNVPRRGEPEEDSRAVVVHAGTANQKGSDQDWPELPGGLNLSVPGGAPPDQASKAEKMADLQELMNRYGVAFNPAQAEKLLGEK